VDRKDFLKSAARACVACAGVKVLSGQENRPDSAQTEKERQARAAEQQFKEAYILTLMQNMEKEIDGKTRTRLMERCGRACARRGSLYDRARELKGDLDGFLKAMAGVLGKENVVRNGDVITWGYPRCFCELVAGGPARLPDTYCLCSVGWVHEMFETVSQKPVRVELLQSVKRGATSCKFLIRL